MFCIWFVYVYGLYMLCNCICFVYGLFTFNSELKTQVCCSVLVILLKRPDQIEFIDYLSNSYDCALL